MNTTAVTITVTLLRIGAHMGAPNTPRVFRIAARIAAMP
jgi:hypothetical protein